jgi:hypothetical protein
MTDSPPPVSIWLGYDSKETTAFAVAKYSIRRFDRHIPIKGLVMDHLRESGLYYRETKRVKHGRVTQLRDVISDAPMSTEFSISRFLVPHLAKSGWALFADSDVIFRSNVNALFHMADPSKALMCVQHNYKPTEEFKKGGLLQTQYPRKNWSSVMLFNCDHPSNAKLTVEMVNTLPGRDLHRFCWLEDDEIGALPPEWNYLVGASNLNGKTPAIVHFTEGLPDIPGYEAQEFAEEWRAMRPYAVGAL